MSASACVSLTESLQLEASPAAGLQMQSLPQPNASLDLSYVPYRELPVLFIKMNKRDKTGSGGTIQNSPMHTRKKEKMDFESAL